MICKNCGTNNSKNDTFCSYCGEKLDTRNYNNKDREYQEYNYKKTSNKKNISPIIVILIVIILIFIGGYLLLGDKILNKDVSISNIDINGTYQMDGETYVFDVNDSVVIEPEIEPSNKDVDLKYELSDDDVANISELDNKCSIVGLKAEKVNLNIYDGDKILKVIKISFEDNSVKDSNIDTSNNSVNNQQSSSSDNSSNSNNSNQDNTSNSSTESIPFDKLDSVASSYLYDYQQAMNYGDFSFLSEDLIKNGGEYKETKKNIPVIYEKGITLELQDYNRTKAKKIADGIYSATYVVHWKIYNPQEDTTRIQMEKADYIIKQSGGTYKLDRRENLKISKQYL